MPEPEEITTRLEFGAALTTVRERASLTVRDVAQRCGMSASTVGGYFSGRHLPPLKPPGQLEQILGVCGVSDDDVVAAWTAALARVRTSPGPRPRGEAAPYRGLAAFRAVDAPWFFGRDELVAEVLHRVGGLQESGGGMLALVGPSGAGKSSLLQAGILPRLEAESPTAAPVYLTPGEHPVRALEALLQGDPSAPGNAEPGLVILVDQLEEVFTLCADQQERVGFVQALSQWSSNGVVVLAALRADFYAHALADPLLMQALRREQVVIGPMDRDGLRAVIEEPARRAHVAIDEGLTEVILDDLTSGRPLADASAGALPLLSHAMLATWQRSRRGRMTVADYRGAGGIQGAVAATAETVYGSLDASQRTLARRLLRRLVTTTDEATITRRPVAPGELGMLPGSPDADTLRTVIERFVDARLLTADTDTVEIAHEALLTAWPRLWRWLDEDRAGLATHRQLTLAAQTWQDSNRDPSALPRGGRLATIREWADRYGMPELNDLEQTFLSAATALEAAEQEASRRGTRRLKILVVALTIVALMAGTAMVVAVGQRDTIAHERDLALSRQVAAASVRIRASDVGLSAQLAVAAYRLATTPEARAALLDTSAAPSPTRLLASEGVLQAVAISRDQHLLAAAGEGGRLHLWSLPSGRSPQPLPDLQTGGTMTIFALALSPDGQHLVAAGADGNIRYWDVTDPARARLLAETSVGTTSTIYALTFSPDGHMLAAGAADRTIHRWDVTNPSRPAALPSLTGATDSVQALAYDPTGRILAAGSADHTVHLWDVSRLNPAPTVLTGPAKAVFAVGFSPDGTRLAAGGRDGKVYVWPFPVTGTPTATVLTGPTSWVNGITFSPDGRTLAAASSDSRLWIWDLPTGASPNLHGRAIFPQPAPITAARWTADGRTLITAGADGVVRLWPALGRARTFTDGIPYELTFADHGHLLAAASTTNDAQLWDLTDPSRPVPAGDRIQGPSADAKQWIGSAVLTPDAKTLALGGKDGTVQLMDVSDPTHPHPAGPALTGGPPPS
ncbi:MAG TPA: helix-turn-helix domain-containing protein, partial [Kineosporiaceae bacterium]